AAADLQRAPGNLARVRDSLPIDYADNDVDGVLFETLEFPKVSDRDKLTVDIKRLESLAFRPMRHVRMKTLARFHQWREDLQRSTLRSSFDLFYDRRYALPCDRQIAFWTKLCSGFCEQQSEEMVNFRHRRDGRFAAAARHPLFNRHARRQSADQIDIGFLELLDELPSIRRHAVEKTALPFSKQDVEGESRFAGAAQTSNYYELLTRDLDIDVLEIVLTRSVDVNGAVALTHAKSGSGFCSSRQLNAVILSASEGFFQLARDFASSLVVFAARDDGQRFKSF